MIPSLNSIVVCRHGKNTKWSEIGPVGKDKFKCSNDRFMMVGLELNTVWIWDAAVDHGMIPSLNSYAAGLCG